MSRRKTIEEFNQEVTELGKGEYEVLGDYVNNRTGIKMLHKTCGRHYYARPDEFLRGKRCRNCFENKKSTTEIFIDRVSSLCGDDYTVTGEYINNRTHIEMRHNVCGTNYSVRPDNFITGKRCPKCSGNAKKTTEEFTLEVFDLVGEEFRIMGDYINSNTKIEIFHKKCGEVYRATPTDFLSGKRCPRCSESKGERKISSWLKSTEVPYSPQHKVFCSKNRQALILDFLISGIAIEYDGKQHFEPVDFFGGVEGLRAQQRRDRIKDKYCADNGIPLIRIPYWDFDNIDAILTQKLLPLLGEKAA